MNRDSGARAARRMVMTCAAVAVLTWPSLGARQGARAQSAFSEGYRLVDTWKSREPGANVARFRRPAGVDVSPDGAVFVADEGAGRVFQLAATGQVTARWDATDGMGRLIDVAASLERVIVLGTNLAEVRTRDGVVQSQVSVPGATGVADGPDGRFYVVRRTGADLQAETVIDVMDRDGLPIETWSADPFVIMSPRGLTVAADGAVYLAADGAVYLYRDGAVKGGLRLPDGISGGEVHDVDLDASGRLFAVQGDTSRRIIVWNTDTGAAIGLQLLNGATALAVGPGDGLTVSTNVGNGFAGLTFVTSRSDLSAQPQQWGAVDASLGRLVAPRRVAVSAAGSAYLLDVDRVQRWDPAGQPLEQWPQPVGDYAVDVVGGGELPCVTGSRTVHCFGPAGTTAWGATPAVEGWITAADGSTGSVALLDLAEQRVWLLDRSGTSAGSAELVSRQGFVVAPDIAVDGTALYWVDPDAGVIRMLDTSSPGTPGGTIAARGTVKRVAARDGRLYALTEDGWIWKYAADGTAITAWQPATAGRPEDLAAGPAGRVYVADPSSAQVLVFEPGAAAPPVPPEPEPSRCAVAGNKMAAPSEVLQGNRLHVTLTVRGSCPGGDGRIDVVLIVDQSGSMAGTPLASAQAAAVSFLGYMTAGRAQVGLVGFSTTATVLQPLTSDLRSVVRAVGRITPGGQTVYAQALEAALAELAGPRGRTDVPQIVVMMSDGKPTDRTEVLEAAAELKELGIVVYTIGLGADVDADLLAMIAGTPDLYFDAPTEADLASVYASIARRIIAGQLLGSGTVVDVLPPDMHYVYGSASPPAEVIGRTLRWQLASVPTTGIDLTYDVRPSVPGSRPTNESALLDYVDAAGQTGQLAFPVPVVEVLPRLRWTTFLPQVWKHQCKPQRADVVLVFDTSSSMMAPEFEGSTRTKLDAALAAGRAFLGAMQLPEDQAAIVSFDNDGRKIQELTGSRAELEMSLATVTSSPGTRIDKGLELAVVELLGARHRERNNPVIVLLSDGLPEAGTEKRTLQIAMDARAAGIMLYTIGLGQDADADLLWLLSGDAGRTFEAPDASQLNGIYWQIAGKVLCY